MRASRPAEASEDSAAISSIDSGLRAGEVKAWGEPRDLRRVPDEEGGYFIIDARVGSIASAQSW
jgi:hypothetical protein